MTTGREDYGWPHLPHKVAEDLVKGMHDDTQLIKAKLNELESHMQDRLGALEKRMSTLEDEVDRLIHE
jgi:hypothetical protein